MKDCVFCKIINGEFSSYKLYEDDKVMAFLDITPMSYGHTLIVPKEHYKDYTDIPLDILTHINKVGKELYDKLNDKLEPTGIQLVQNNGILQEVKHYHLHLIPFYCKERNDKTDKPGKDKFEEVLKTIME